MRGGKVTSRFWKRWHGFQSEAPSRGFLFEKALLGKDAKSADVVGIELADKKVLGDAKNVKFRFDPTFMKLAADGKL